MHVMAGYASGGGVRRDDGFGVWQVQKLCAQARALDLRRLVARDPNHT
jgi:hypothetical protein